ncbi:MAG: tetratricopeptide repeat protein [Bacteroidetes bacterium]|nr:tetratricopeptide repeat protein [Bacteroidota bacterium]
MEYRTFEELYDLINQAISINDAVTLERCATELEELGTMKARSIAFNARGVAERIKGNYALALQHYQRSLDLAEELGSSSAMASTIGNIGNIYLAIGDPAQALDHFQRALVLHRENGDRSKAAIIMESIGVVYAETSQYALALHYYHEALAEHTELDNRNSMATAYGNIGLVYSDTGDYPAALEQLHKALPLHEEVNDLIGIARATNNIGNIYHVAGNNALALEHYTRALALNEKVGYRHGVSSTTGSIGDVYISFGNTEIALEHFRRAADLCSELQDIRGLAWNYGRIMSALLDAGSYAEAEATLTVLDELHVDDPRAGIFRETSRARLQELQGRIDEAAETLRSVMATAVEYSLAPEMSVIHKQLRDLALKRNDLAAYVEHSNEYTRITEEINGRDAATKIAMQAKQREIDAKERETQKQLAVLHSTLPKEVAERVARGEVVNDHFENAAVIFLDIVGFTEISSTMSSQEVITLLDDVFTQCDAICAKYGVTKIKTIGDSYMCVSFDNVVNAALCALEMSRIVLSHEVSHNVSHSVSHSVSHVEDVLPVSHEVAFRIGMHCGPVTAGVIGKERMQYDVWGDTVNVASRMESTGEPGKLHVSEAFASELKRNTECTIQDAIKGSRNQGSHVVPLVTSNSSLVTQLRGSIDIKGKGPMTTYWLSAIQST